jgi:hypothetical protein
MASVFGDQPGECAESSGFLFSHRCGELAQSNCAECRKFICPRHTVSIDQRMLCTTCAKGVKRGERQSNTYYDDPYFYSSYYYPGYHVYHHGHHHSSHDFTDADEAALGAREANDEDVKAFENNMGAS